MNLKHIILSGLFLLAFTCQTKAQSSKVIWNSKGEVEQSIRQIKTSKNGETNSAISFQFCYIKFSTLIDSGSFLISNQVELTHLIEDLQGAIKKSKEKTSFEWSRKNYTLKSGGANSAKKGNFKLFIGKSLCPMDKKNTKKLIKAIQTIKDQLKEEA